MEYEGKKLVPGQANNVFIFPGVGFGSVMIKAKTVTDDMFVAAARGLADYVSKEQIAKGNIYPDINDLRNISAAVSCHGLGRVHWCNCLCMLLHMCAQELVAGWTGCCSLPAVVPPAAES